MFSVILWKWFNQAFQLQISIWIHEQLLEYTKYRMIWFNILFVYFLKFCNLQHFISLIFSNVKSMQYLCIFMNLMLLFLCTNFFSLVQISMSITCHFILFAKSIAFPRHFWHEYLTPSLSSCWCRIILLGFENFRVVIIRLT